MFTTVQRLLTAGRVTKLVDARDDRELAPRRKEVRAVHAHVHVHVCVHVRTFDRPQFCSEIVRCYHPFPGGGGYGGMGVGSAPQG